MGKLFLCLFYGVILFGFLSSGVFAQVNLSIYPQPVNENSPQTLTCTYTGAGIANITWMIGTQAIGVINIVNNNCQIFKAPNPALYSYTCSAGTNAFTLTILNVTRSNKGQMLSCEVFADDRTIQSQPVTPDIIVHISNVTMTQPWTEVVIVQVNTTAIFVCETSGGLPEAQVTWFKDPRTADNTADDIDITVWSTSSTSNTNDNLIKVTSRLTFSPQMSDRNMRIYCSANNGGSAVLVSFRKPLLNVHLPSVLSPDTVTVPEYSKQILSCYYNGTENVKDIRWAVNDTQVGVILTSNCSDVGTPTVNRFLYSYSCTGGYTWTILNLTSANQGDNWQCASNVFGIGFAISNRVITYIYVAVPITSVTMTQPVTDVLTVQLNTTAVFVCETSGGLPAAQVTWFKDSRTADNTVDDIDITVGITVSTSNSGGNLIKVTSRLNYSPLKSDRNMRIYCKANNGGSTTYISSRKPLLDVQYKPEPPTYFKNLDEKVTLSSVTLQWVPGFNGGLPQTFVLQYRKKGTEQWTTVNIIHHNETMMTYPIQHLSSGTQYEVVLFAANSIGNSEQSQSITVSTYTADSRPGNTGAVIGGAVGGGTAGVILVAVAVIIIWRIRMWKGNGEKQLALNNESALYTDLKTSQREYTNMASEYSELKTRSESNFEDSVPDPYTEIRPKKSSTEDHIYNAIDSAIQTVPEDAKVYVNLQIDQT